MADPSISLEPRKEVALQRFIFQVSAITLLGLLSANEIKDDSTGLVQMTYAAASPLPIRIREVAMVSVSQPRGSELFLLDCFEPPTQQGVNAIKGRSITCLFQGQGHLRKVFKPDDLVWQCHVSASVPNMDAKVSDAFAPQYVHSTPLIGLMERGAGGPYPIHIVNCLYEKSSNVGTYVVVSVTGNDNVFAISKPYVVPVPLPPLVTTKISANKNNAFIAGYLCVSDTFWDMAINFNIQFDGMVVAITLSVKFHLALGMDHISVFFDLNNPEPFILELATTLRNEVSRAQVTFVKARVAGPRHDLEFQEMLNNVALWWHKGQAAWLAVFDVDEYFQPFSVDTGATEFEGALRKFVKRAEAARLNVTGPASIAVRSQFWWGPEDWTTDLLSLRFRPAGDYIHESQRTKSIYSTADVLTCSVHLPVEPASTLVPSTSELRLNHFKFFGGKRQDGPVELDDSFAELWFALGLAATSCSSRARPRCDRTEASTQWTGPVRP